MHKSYKTRGHLQEVPWGDKSQLGPKFLSFLPLLHFFSAQLGTLGGEGLGGIRLRGIKAQERPRGELIIITSTVIPRTQYTPGDACA